MSPHISRSLQWPGGCLSSLITSAGEHFFLRHGIIAFDCAADTRYAAAYAPVEESAFKFQKMRGILCVIHIYKS